MNSKTASCAIYRYYRSFSVSKARLLDVPGIFTLPNFVVYSCDSIFSLKTFEAYTAHLNFFSISRKYRVWKSRSRSMWCFSLSSPSPRVTYKSVLLFIMRLRQSSAQNMKKTLQAEKHLSTLLLLLLKKMLYWWWNTDEKR